MGGALDRGCFTGDGAQHLVAFDPANGDILRHAGFADDLSNGPETYLLDGHQYLVVGAGALYTPLRSSRNSNALSRVPRQLRRFLNLNKLPAEAPLDAEVAVRNGVVQG